MEKEKDGVWRTIRGRRIFIASGQSLGEAMAKSGKFNRSDIRETKEGLSQKDKFDRTNSQSLKQRQKAIKDFRKKDTRYSNSVYTTDRQDEKNRTNENAHIEGSGQTRVQRNWNKYSEADRREHRHELIQKKLADYKAKKQSNVKIKEGNPIEDLANDRIKEKENTLANDKAMLEVMKRKGIKEVNGWTEKDFENRIKKNEDYLEQSNNKVDDNYYKGTKRWGFGYANDDNIPVYNNNIDYTGDFTHANLSKVSDDDLIKALNKQSELYHEASNRQVGDRRTRNGKNDEIFKKTDLLRYENGMNKINEEMQNRNMPRYNIYNKKNNMIMASSPTQEMADRQLKEMIETDKKLGEHYGWKEYPEYKVKTGYVDDYLKETKDSKEKIKAYKEKKQSNNLSTKKTFDSLQFEKTIPHEMRWKEHSSVNDGKDMYWITQEPFTKEQLDKFVKSFKKQDRYEKAYITVRDFSTYDFEKDRSNHVLVLIDKNGKVYDTDYKGQMKKNGWDY